MPIDLTGVPKIITGNHYQAEAGKTATYIYAAEKIRDSTRPNVLHTLSLMYAALGLAGEAGEVANKVKKLFRDKGGAAIIAESDRQALGDELGDVLWYAAAIATELGLSLDEIMYANLQKLADRNERDTLSGDGDNR